MTFIKSFDKTKLFYIFHKGKKDTLIFLHGWSLNHTTWRNSHKYFSEKNYSTLCLDMRGHGNSDSPIEEERYSLEIFANDIHYIIKKEKLENVVLVGHSLGGMIALKFLEMYPEICKKVVLVDTSYHSPFENIKYLNDPKMKDYSLHLLDYILEHKSLQTKHFEQVDFSKIGSHSDFYYWLLGLKNTPVVSLLMCLKEMLKFDELKLLDKINVPVLIFHGEKDFQIPLNDSHFMNKKIKNSKLVILKGASHDTPINDWRKMNFEILKFLELD